MKVKKYLLWLFSLLFIPSFSSANVITGSIPWDFYNTQGSYSYSYFIDKYLNFSTNTQFKLFFTTYQNWYIWTSGPRSWALFWNDWKIAWYWNLAWQYSRIIKQWYYNSFCYSNLNDYVSYCVPSSQTSPWNYIEDIQTFYDLGAIYDSFYLNTNNLLPYLCFISNSRNIVSCFWFNLTNNDSVFWDLNKFITSESILAWTPSSPWNFDQTKFWLSSLVSSSHNNNINIICPTIWEIKKNSGLTKNVCYAWFTEDNIYWDSSTFTAWTWLNILQVYEMYSWWMNIQSRYETYREYYKNINSNTSQFENKSKALLGTFFARQTFWNNKTSYQILNYCNLELSNLPDNATTCTANTWWIHLPLEQAKPTVEDITQRITQQQTNTVLPWWTNQNNSWNIQGESIYADIITNTNYGIFDIIDNINSIYNKMTWIFEKRWNVQWIIPIYITWIILLFVLFKLRKK